MRRREWEDERLKRSIFCCESRTFRMIFAHSSSGVEMSAFMGGGQNGRLLGGNLYDFRDFVNCVDKAGKAVLMKPSNFKAWQNELSHGKSSKLSRPLLDTVVVAEFRRGSYELHFKTSHDGGFRSSDFLKKLSKMTLRRRS